jgi:arsenite methyltransferase
MSTTLNFDADLAARIEAVYATPDVAATRVAVFRALGLRAGEHALDVGCGPGYLTRDLALAVGSQGAVTAVDMSEPMLGLAAQRCAGLGQVRLERGDATELPLEAASIDAACGLQVYCYVRELEAALSDLRRALKPAGRAVILDTDFSGVVWESRNRERMRAVLRAFDAHAAWPDLPRVLPAKLRQAGLEVERCEAVPFVTLAYHANTYVYGLARFIHQFVTKNAGVSLDEADAWLAELDALEAERAFFYSTNRFMFVVRRRA